VTQKLLNSLRKGIAVKRTICEVFREMNDIVEQMETYEKEELQKLILEGFGYAKKMDDKLRGYKWKTDNENFVESYMLRKAR
jgi:hypothetical protein